MNFLSCKRGSFAVEFAIIAPVAIFGLGVGVDLIQLNQQRVDTSFVAQSAATAASAVLRAGGSQADATAKALAIRDANTFQLTRLGAMTVTFPDGLVQVELASEADALFPLVAALLTTSVKATA